MTTDRAELLARLAERVALGDAIDPSEVPAALRDAPEFAQLLRLARVAGVLDHNTAAPDPRPAAAPARIGPWRLLRAIGSGGMGEVWLGERDDGTVEQRVAIKRVRADLPQFAARLREERRILARLEHPNIARFVDAGLDDGGAPWLALEYIDGATLSEWCRRNAPPLAERLRLFLRICAAVEHAHRHLVVHRDLKPGNVLVDAAGEPKLLDFGIAKLLDGSGREATAAALTPAYAAPEQLRGGEVSTATDVYALGLLLFRLLADGLPDTRTGDSAAAVLARLDDEETQRPSARAARADALPYPASALAGDLDAIVAQAIRARPEDRYGTVAEFAADLERHLDSRPVRARAPTLGYRFARFATRHRLPLALAVLALAALVGGTLAAVQQARRAQAEAARAEAEAQAARDAAGRAERGQRFLVDLFASASPETNQGRMPSARDLIARGGDELARADLPAADRAALAATLAESWTSLGDAAAARRAAALAMAAGRATEPATAARAALVLARLSFSDGDLAGAGRLYAHAATLAAAAGGDAAMQASEAQLGASLLALYAGDYPRSLLLAQQAYEARLAAFGAGDPATLNAGVARAVALISNDRLDDAIDAFRAVATAADARLGRPNAPSVRARTSLSDALERRGDYAEALASGREAAQEARAVFGPRHQLYGQAEMNAGFALGRLGRHDEALAHYARAREAYAATGHFDEGSALRYAAGALLSLERWADAEDLLAEAEAVLARQLGPDAELVLAARINRASALAGRGALAQAAELATRSLAQARATLPPENSTHRNALRVLGNVRREQGRAEDAVAAHRELLAVETRVSGATSPPAALAGQLLARGLLRRGQPGDADEAAALLDAAVGVLDQPGRGPMLLAAALLDRADLFARRDRDRAAADRGRAADLLREAPAVPPSLARRLRD
jgi:serine/threonine-protein kinase